LGTVLQTQSSTQMSTVAPPELNTLPVLIDRSDRSVNLGRRVDRQLLDTEQSLRVHLHRNCAAPRFDDRREAAKTIGFPFGIEARYREQRHLVADVVGDLLYRTRAKCDHSRIRSQPAWRGGRERGGSSGPTWLPLIPSLAGQTRPSTGRCRLTNPPPCLPLMSQLFFCRARLISTPTEKPVRQ